MTEDQAIKTTAVEELRENIGTARIVRRARVALATHKEILLPMRVVDRLVSGANPFHIFHKPVRRKR
jgi:hypothetical protein